MGRQRLAALLALSGLLLFANGCDLFGLEGGASDIAVLIESNREKWEGANVQTYAMTYNRTVGQDLTEDIEVFVVNDQIDSAAVAGEAAADPERYLTVDGAFDVLMTAFNREGRGGFQVAFDEELGYPERFRVSPGGGSDGEGLVVTEFASNP